MVERNQYAGYRVKETRFVQLRKTDSFYSLKKNDYLTAMTKDFKLQDLQTINWRSPDKRLLLPEQIELFESFPRVISKSFYPEAKLDLVYSILQFLKKYSMSTKNTFASNDIFIFLIITFNKDILSKLLFLTNNTLDFNNQLVKETYYKFLRNILNQLNYLNSLSAKTNVYTKFRSQMPATFLLKSNYSFVQFDESSLNLLQDFIVNSASHSYNQPDLTKKFLDIFYLKRHIVKGLNKNMNISLNCSINNTRNSSIFFIRNQRRYNKRRYSRVRAFSRPSFFAGSALSTLLVAMFFGGSIKSVD